MPTPPSDTVLFSSPLYFAIEGQGRGSAPPAAGTLEIDGERMAILPRDGAPILIPWTEVLGLSDSAHALRLTLASLETVVLSRIGARSDDCLLALARARNEALLDAFWMREAPAAPPTAAEYLPDGSPARPCEVRLLETALVVLFPDGDPVRLPYALVDAVLTEDRRVVLRTRWKGRWTLGKFGRAFDAFTDALARATHTLHTSHLDLIRRALPGLDPAALRGAAGLLRDGVAVPIAQLDAAGLWVPLERALAETHAAEELAALRAMASGSNMRAGLKRGLAGNRSGDYLFFLVPLAAAIALETARLDGEKDETDGRATYLFNGEGGSDEALDDLNRLLLDLNFRREPLLAPEGGLPRRRPAALDALRGRLLGRVVHRSPEQWKAEVLALAGTAGKGTP